MPEFPDYSKLKPKRTVNRCEVQLTVSLVGEGSTRAVARDHGQVITPWQAYLTYQMDDDGENRNISATCGYGFVVGNVRVANDPEPGAALAGDAVMGVEDRSMTHTCTRVVSPDDH